MMSTEPGPMPCEAGSRSISYIPRSADGQALTRRLARSVKKVETSVKRYRARPGGSAARIPADVAPVPPPTSSISVVRSAWMATTADGRTRPATRLFFLQAEVGIRDYKVTGVQTYVNFSGANIALGEDSRL